MKTLFAASCVAFLVAGHAAIGLAAEQPGQSAAGQPADESASAQTSTSAAANETQGQAKNGGKTDSPPDVDRHRPGACPEGPPCKIDD
jgi:hypothetical protein